jgi:hypothetical protein
VLLALAAALVLGTGFFLYQQRAHPLAAPPAVSQEEKQTAPPVEVPARAAVPPPAPTTNSQVTPAVAVINKTPDNKAPAVPAESTYVLTARPAGALAVFDQDVATECRTPCTLTLPAGRHSVAIRADGYRTAQRTFNLPQDSTTYVELERAQGFLTLVTDTKGLTVFVDGKEQERKTPATFTLPIGPHKIELLKGTDRNEFNVEIRDGAALTQTVKW